MILLTYGQLLVVIVATLMPPIIELKVMMLRPRRPELVVNVTDMCLYHNVTSLGEIKTNK